MAKPVYQIIFFVAISCFLTSFFFYTLQLNLFFSVGLAVLLQYAISYVYGSVIDLYTFTQIKKIELEKAKELSYQVVEAVCPCSPLAKELVPIRINRPNYYKCSKCQKNVAVYLNVETAIVTEPIANTDLAAIDRLISEKLNEHTTKH